MCAVTDHGVEGLCEGVGTVATHPGRAGRQKRQQQRTPAHTAVTKHRGATPALVPPPRTHILRSRHSCVTMLVMDTVAGGIGEAGENVSLYQLIALV